MTEPTESARGWYEASAVARTPRPSLTFDLDVDVCVVGAGLAGLTAALEAARAGATVAVIEAREVGWNASGHNLGSVAPGFCAAIERVASRVGFSAARELWTLSEQGAAYVRSRASEAGLAVTDGALTLSDVDTGDGLDERLRLLEDFGSAVEGWPADRVREAVRTRRYFHGLHDPHAFHLHALSYARALVAQAERAGVRLFEGTPVVGIDAAGVRKRIATPAARLRSSFIVLAGSVHLGPSFPRLSETLLPTWRYAAITEPLGAGMEEVLSFQGTTEHRLGLERFRRIDGDRLIWSGPLTTWPINPKHVRAQIRRRIARVFPQLGEVAIADAWSAVTGETVHGMPQIGELRRGLWLASGFGDRGLASTAIAGVLVADGMLAGDERWRSFSPFELVWSGGTAGRVAAQAVDAWSRGAAAIAGAMARYRERAGLREQDRQRRTVAAAQAVRAMRAPEGGTRPRPPAAR
jgi:glycine/D-amino acid oxidase-like deaminating enzyme